MIFFHEDVVLNDLNRFAKSMEDKYKIPYISIHKEHIDGLFYGFSFVKDNYPIFIKMPYIENEMGEIAIDESNKFWILEVGNEQFNHLKTLGDVFEKLDEILA